MRTAHTLQQFAAVEPRQHEVEDQHIVRVGVDVALALAAVACQVHDKALGAQTAGHKFPELAVILNDQHSHVWLPRNQLKRRLTPKIVSPRRHRTDTVLSYVCHTAATHCINSRSPGADVYLAHHIGAHEHY